MVTTKKMTKSDTRAYSVTVWFAGDLPVILNLKHLREANPRILKRYRVPADRYFN